MRQTENYVLFWGNDDIYSNFYLTEFTVGGRRFNCSEQYFMFYKAMFFGDTKVADEIMAEKVPYEQKKLGRKVKGFDAALWDKQCVSAMTEACLHKFTANIELRDKLLATGDAVLVEASPYDKIWGIGLGENDPRALDESKWRGQNLLGKVLMSVRATLANDMHLAMTAQSHI